METNKIQLSNNQIELSNAPLNLPSNNSPLGFQINQQGTYDQLNKLFIEKDHQQKTILETREILGESAKDLSDNQVYDLVNEIQYLVDSWLKEFEMNVFNGKTLDKLIGLNRNGYK